ncbi:MAG TPA: carotenoid biosynthesis protein [Candidatus Nanoarchaeia archaeon]|nr:carotenoid biosynthesis protein [Candidatus Nanoarchaeia archaeon]
MVNLLFIEIPIIILAILCLPTIIKDKYKLKIFLLALVYATIFENLNILLSEGKAGGYFYNPNFLLFLFDTPLFVIISWALIILSSMLISNNLPIKEKFKPFSDALLILAIDLSVDVVAIRHNLWFWNEYSLNEGFFGIPANNFIGWLLVAFVFCLAFRLLENSRYKEKIFLHSILPFISYAGFLFLFYFATFTEQALRLDKFTELFLVLFLVILFLTITLIEKTKKKTKAENKQLISIIRIPFHFYAFMGIFTLKLYNEWLILNIVLFVLIVDLIINYFTKQKSYK